MGYTIFYEGRSEYPLTDDEHAKLHENVLVWDTRLSEVSEDYGFTYSDGTRRLSGSTKIGYSETEESHDLDMLLYAIEELDQILPGYHFTVHDDSDALLFESPAPAPPEPSPATEPPRTARRVIRRRSKESS